MPSDGSSVDPSASVRLLVDTLNRNDWPALQKLLHPTLRRHSMAASESGEETASQFVQFLKAEHQTYPDAHEELLDVFVYIALYRVENGAIMESWAEWDPASDLRQLGHGMKS
jgi:hypothetical protein